jgi:hypothetical protein
MFLWEAGTFLIAFSSLMAVKGYRVGTWYLLMVLLVMAPLLGYYIVDRIDPRLGARFGLAAAGATLLLGGAALLVTHRRKRILQTDDLFGFRLPPDSTRTQGRLVGHGWMYRRVRLAGRVAACVEIRFTIEHDPTSRVFGYLTVCVEDQEVLREAVVGWFAPEYEFSIPAADATYAARLALRVGWPVIRLRGMQIDVQEQTTYREGCLQRRDVACQV